jgi:TatD DNase family protein
MYINIHTHKQSLHGLAIQSLHVGEEPSTQYFSCGYHPWYISDDVCNIEKLREQVLHLNCLAIGEIGIDKMQGPNLAIQTNYLEQQLLLAQEINKPVIIHNVKSTSEILSALTKFKDLRVIFHGFNLKIHLAENVLNAGHCLSFGKHLLANNSNAQLALKVCPQKQFFLETDDANLDISDVYKHAAALRDISLEDLQQQIRQNFNATFATSF